MLREGRYGYILETTKLNKLFAYLHIACDDERELLGISDDSREIKKDWLFISRNGYEYHGVEYIQEVLRKGAVVLCDRLEYEQENVYYVANIAHIQQALLELYYGDVCKNLKVIGVTGTNGKTSVASILTQLLHFEHEDVMQIGTGFIRYKNIDETIHNTTPGCFQLANYFRTANKLHIPYIVMEVSSHAIDQNRINFIHFDYIVYTNITQDHLDYHLTKTQYRYTKFKLRRYLKPEGTIVYNSDLSYMQELVNLAHHNCISIGTQEAHFPIRDIQLSEKGVCFQLQGYTYQCSLLSIVNVYNLAQAIVICRRLGISYEQLQTSVSFLQPIAGRLEVIDCDEFTIWIDYAHTPDAVKTLLEFANMVKKGRSICVVGCGGNRDKSKRVIMGGFTARYADIAVFTSDNPRNESIHKILQDMMPKDHENVLVYENRRFAIKHTIKNAEKSDIIIIAGKGCENEITVFGKKYPFSDRQCVLDCLREEELHWK